LKKFEPYYTKAEKNSAFVLKEIKYSTSHLPEIWREQRKIGTSNPRQSKRSPDTKPKILTTG